MGTYLQRASAPPPQGPLYPPCVGLTCSARKQYNTEANPICYPAIFTRGMGYLAATTESDASFSWFKGNSTKIGIPTCEPCCKGPYFTHATLIVQPKGRNRRGGGGGISILNIGIDVLSAPSPENINMRITYQSSPGKIT